MSPRLESVRSASVPPKTADVVVVGAGIVGVSAALTLAERGSSVVVVEKGVVAGEQSSRNWGWCREQLRALPELPLAMRSMQLWRGMSARIGGDSGYRETGMMVVSKDEEEVERWRAWLDATAACGLQGGILSAAETRSMLPGTAETWIAAIHSPTDGWAEPSMATPAMARGAQKKGAVIVENCAVRGWETEAGRVARVVTEKGTIRAGSVLVAGGAWSAMLLRRMGAAFPQSGVYASAFRTEAAPEVYAGGVGSPRFSFRRRIDGGYTIGMRGRGRVDLTPMGLMRARQFMPLFFRRKGELTLGLGRSFFEGPFALRRWRLDGRSPFEAQRILDPAPDPALVEAGMAAFRAAYPAMAEIGVKESWGGLIDATPDMVPVIGPVPDRPGVFLASGFSGHGFALGPGAGWLAAMQILGEAPGIDDRPFRFSRYDEGQPHPAHHWI
ncbi:FAD-dependent oxidoreductase [Jiella sonneratiae]|uniref:FAD-binding oxidoreductase n=1 Tax=Jiella sonneratiae TaxID=2816856 RepID=A0ABS3J999_9HYPH|nr:FAD-binding oxidoreductase [Jiella sonneratiae]